MTSSSHAALVKKTHPIRGFLWGIMFGLGLGVVLVVTGVIPLELSQLAIVTIIGSGLGVVWGLFGPAKAPKGPAPTTRSAAMTPVVTDEVTDVSDPEPEPLRGDIGESAPDALTDDPMAEGDARADTGVDEI